MTIQEFEKKYNLHDSTIKNIEYSQDGKELKMTIDFCYWDQEWYKEGNPEFMELRVTFHGIDGYEEPLGDVNLEIWNDEIKNGKYFLFLQDYFNQKYYEKYLTPSDIDVEIIRTYSENEE